MKRQPFSSHAQSDIAEAYAWYEKQSSGLGDDFLMAVHEQVGRITALPEMGMVYRTHFRRVLLSRFPYALFYRTNSQGIRVVAVFHHRQGDATRHGRLR